jgi:outer membrane receptor protein involved in Fe transport
VATTAWAPGVGIAQTVPQLGRLGIRSEPQAASAPQETAPAETAPTEAAPAEAAATQAPVTDAEATPRITGIRGRVVDAQTGEPLIEASVRVTRGAKRQARTDLEGNFVLRLAPGSYDIRVSYDLYTGSRLTGIIVGRGEATVVEIRLEPDESAVEEVVVEAKADTRTEAGILQTRKKAVTANDSVSAQQIARSPDSSAADAAKRVPSATVVEGRYVFVRGLGGRYSMTLVNRTPVPSPDPDEQAVPLDLFPAALLSNLTVVKTYSADLPGQFAGGTLLIETSAYPRDLQLKLNASAGFDSETTFRDRRDYPGGDLDFLGFDDGTRDLPDSVPDDGPARSGMNGLDDPAIEAIGEDFSNVWSTHETQSPPNFSLGATVGDTVRVKGKKLGYLGTLGFGRKLERRATEVRAAGITGGELTLRQELLSTVGTETATLGGLGNVSFEPAPNHDVEMFALYTHKGRDRAQLVTGFSETDGLEIEDTRLQFVEQALAFGQLHGRHRLARAGDLVVEWQGNASLARRDEPDTRDIHYFVLEDGRIRYQNQPGSGERFFSSLKDVSGGGGLHVERPLGRLRPRLGGSAQHTERSFSARRLRFDFVGRDPSVLFLPPEDMLSPENIGPFFELEERTLPSDAYDASLTILAGYAALEVGVTDDLRVIPGVRYEVADQALTPGTPFAIAQAQVEGVDRTDSSVLPSANVVYAIGERMNLRGAYSRTLARPHFRELAPFLFFDYTRRRSVSGNPALVETRIHNADARWELFPAETEVVAASFFYKRFEDPIEQVIVNAGQGDISFDNAAGARTLGVELEGRVALRRLWRALNGFRAGANLSWIHSRVDLTGEQVGSQTNSDRPMQGQSPYVVNLDLGFARRGTEVTALYNVFGRRLEEVGTQGLPDVYEQPFHRVDLVASQDVGRGFRLKLGGTNLLNRSVVVKQGDFTVESYPVGVTGTVTVSWSK